MKRTALVLLLLVPHFIYSAGVSRERGYDFPVYYAAAHGVLQDGTGGTSPWVYSPKVAVLFRPLKEVPYVVAFGVVYGLNLLGLAGLVSMLGRVRSSSPVLGWCATVGAGVVYLVVLRLGNVSGVLALACTTWWGTLLAGCVKPYLLALLPLHAAAACHGFRSCRPSEVPLETERDFSGDHPGHRVEV